MAQQLQSYGQGPYAEEALRLAEIGRGQEGMSRTAAPVGPNLTDGGGMSKPNVNTQPFNNTRLMEQNMSENVRSAVPAQQANALGQVRKGVAEQSGEEKELKLRFDVSQYSPEEIMVGISTFPLPFCRIYQFISFTKCNTN